MSFFINDIAQHSFSRSREVQRCWNVSSAKEDYAVLLAMPRRIMFLLRASLYCPQKTQKVVDEVWWIFGGVGRVTSTSWLDFGDDSDHDVDSGIFRRNFLPLMGESGNPTIFADNSRSCRKNSCEFFRGLRRLTSNKSFDFRADSDHIPDPGIFIGIRIGLVVRILPWRSFGVTECF